MNNSLMTFNTFNNKKPYNNGINVDYKPEYCQLLIEYAKHNINPDGFWGKHMIDESLKDLWCKTYPEFKQSLALIPHITADLLNESINKVLEGASSSGDVKTIVQILLKMIDMQFKSDKDSGMLKRKGRDLMTAKQNNLDEITDLDIENMKQFMNE